MALPALYDYCEVGHFISAEYACALAIIRVIPMASVRVENSLSLSLREREGEREGEGEGEREWVLVNIKVLLGEIMKLDISGCVGLPPLSPSPSPSLPPSLSLSLSLSLSHSLSLSLSPSRW